EEHAAVVQRMVSELFRDRPGQGFRGRFLPVGNAEPEPVEEYPFPEALLRTAGGLPGGFPEVAPGLVEEAVLVTVLRVQKEVFGIFWLREGNPSGALDARAGVEAPQARQAYLAQSPRLAFFQRS